MSDGGQYCCWSSDSRMLVSTSDASCCAVICSAPAFEAVAVIAAHERALLPCLFARHDPNLLALAEATPRIHILGTSLG